MPYYTGFGFYSVKTVEGIGDGSSLAEDCFDRSIDLRSSVYLPLNFLFVL